MRAACQHLAQWSRSARVRGAALSCRCPAPQPPPDPLLVVASDPLTQPLPRALAALLPRLPTRSDHPTGPGRPARQRRWVDGLLRSSQPGGDPTGHRNQGPCDKARGCVLLICVRRRWPQWPGFSRQAGTAGPQATGNRRARLQGMTRQGDCYNNACRHGWNMSTACTPHARTAPCPCMPKPHTLLNVHLPPRLPLGNGVPPPPFHLPSRLFPPRPPLVCSKHQQPPWQPPRPSPPRHLRCRRRRSRDPGQRRPCFHTLTHRSGNDHLHCSAAAGARYGNQEAPQGLQGRRRRRRGIQRAQSGLPSGR